MITQEYLKRILDYDPETGVFTWIICAGRRAKPGDVAGGNSCGYIKISINSKIYYAHILAWFYVHGVWPDGEIDHINQIKSDNWIKNLRDITHQDNNKNGPLRCTNTSGVTGVSWHRKAEKWMAQITVDGDNLYLGLHEFINDAIIARKMSEYEHNFHENHGLIK